MNLITRGQDVHERTLFEGSAQTNFVMRTTNMPFQSIPSKHNRTEKIWSMGFCVALIEYLPIMHLPMDLVNSTWSPHCGQTGGKVLAGNCFPILTPALPTSQYEQCVKRLQKQRN